MLMLSFLLYSTSWLKQGLKRITFRFHLDQAEGHVTHFVFFLLVLRVGILCNITIAIQCEIRMNNAVTKQAKLTFVNRYSLSFAKVDDALHHRVRALVREVSGGLLNFVRYQGRLFLTQFLDQIVRWIGMTLDRQDGSTVNGNQLDNLFELFLILIYGERLLVSREVDVERVQLPFI